MEKFSLPQREYVVPNQHAYSIGDRVRNINNANWNKHYSEEGVIVKLLPYGTLYAAYDVQYDDKIVATSERSIERIDDGTL